MFLFTIKLNIRIKKTTKGNIIRFYLEKLNNKTTIESYRNILQAELSNLDMVNKSPTIIYEIEEKIIIPAMKLSMKQSENTN